MSMTTLDDILALCPVVEWTKRERNVQVDLTSGHIIIVNYKPTDKRPTFSAHLVEKLWGNATGISKWRIIKRRLACIDIGNAIENVIDAQDRLLAEQIETITYLLDALRLGKVSDALVLVGQVRDLFLLDEQAAEEQGWGMWLHAVLLYMGGVGDNGSEMTEKWPDEW